MTRCMLTLERRYADAGGSPPFLLVGHSMGGLVAQVASADARLPHGQLRLLLSARIAQHLSFARLGLVGAVVTLATPLVTSPWLGQVRECWRTAFWRNRVSHMRNSAARSARDGLLLSPCSPAGRSRPTCSAERRFTVGRAHAFHACARAELQVRRRDIQVPRWLNGAGAATGVFASVEDMPSVQVSTDHQCIVWCNQVVTHTATTLLELASGAADRSRLAAHYWSVLRRRYPADGGSRAAWGFPSRRAVATWAVVSLPKLPALCAASTAAFASEVRVVTAHVLLLPLTFRGCRARTYRRERRQRRSTQS